MQTGKKYLTIVTVAVLMSSLLWSLGCTKSDEKVSDTSSDIKWLYSVSEGLALAKEKAQPAFIDFYADWCPPCQQMEKVTFRDKQVITELARFVAIKADLTRSTSKGQAAAKEYGVEAIPTYVFIDTQGKKTAQVGYRPPAEFLQILKGIK